jgi:hypothetical protein
MHAYEVRPRKDHRGVNLISDAFLDIVRPSESTAETQPQLQPALLRLSAMISQYFTAAFPRRVFGSADRRAADTSRFWNPVALRRFNSAKQVLRIHSLLLVRSDLLRA